MRIRLITTVEPGHFNYWMNLPPGDCVCDGKKTFASAWWTGRYRRVVGIEIGRRWIQWSKC